MYAPISVKLIDHMGDDRLVVNAARVSFDRESQVFNEQDERLLRYLAKHNHWTPFAHPQVCLRVDAPIFVRTQCFKHKQGFVENEVSRRYVDSEPKFYRPRSWRERHESAKQGSGGRHGKQATMNYLLDDTYRHALVTYHKMIRDGICPEQARMVLPQGMMTQWYWTGSLAAWARFYKQRTDSHAQAETREVAMRASVVIGELFPKAWAALTGVED